jgi:hypothetical protein
MEWINIILDLVKAAFFSAEFWSSITDVAIAIAAVTTAVSAAWGVSAWKDQLVGKTEFDQSQRLLTATIKLRKEVERYRSPFHYSGEFPDSYNNLRNHTGSQKAEAYAYMYVNRWKPVASAYDVFEVEMISAEALWDEEIANPCNELQALVRKLQVDTSSFIANCESDNEDFKADPNFAMSVRSSLYSSSDDAFNKEVKNVTDQIKLVIKPHLSRRF